MGFPSRDHWVVVRVTVGVGVDKSAQFFTLHLRSPTSTSISASTSTPTNSNAHNVFSQDPGEVGTGLMRKEVVLVDF